MSARQVRPGRSAVVRHPVGSTVLGVVLRLVGRIAADVDSPSGEPSRQSGVLALLADGQRQLEVGHHHPGRPRVLVDHGHRNHLGRRQRVGDEPGRVLVVVDNVDLLPGQLTHHVAYPLTHGADASALGVQAGNPRSYRDLRTVAGFACHRDDLPRPFGDLGDFQREQFAHQVGVGAGQGDYRFASTATDSHHVAAQPLTVLIDLPGNLLGRRDHTLRALGLAAHSDDDETARIGPAISLHHTGDDIALVGRYRNGPMLYVVFGL